jgi:hypothetical protein
MTLPKLLPPLLLLLVLSATASAQRSKNFIRYHDSTIGKDTTLIGGAFIVTSEAESQYRVIWNKEGKNRTFTSDDVIAYRNGNKMYATQSITVDGTTMRVMMERIPIADEQFIFYLFIRSDGRPLYFYQYDGSLYPLENDADPSYVNPLKTMLMEFAAAQDNDEIKAYIRSMKPTPYSFYDRYKVSATGNINYLTRVRWGLTAGMGIVSGRGINANYSSRMQVYGGAFVDIPFLYDGLSAHAELTYRSNSYSAQYTYRVYESITWTDKYHLVDVDAVYNRHNLCPTILLRYSLVGLRGKWVPYVQAGAEARIVLSGKQQIQSKRVIDGYTSWEESEYPAKSSYGTLVMGGGIEYKLSRRHSLFFDVRYNLDLSKDKLSGACATLSYNF